MDGVKTASKPAVLLLSKLNFYNFLPASILNLIEVPPSSATSVQGNSTFSEGKRAKILLFTSSQLFLFANRQTGDLPLLNSENFFSTEISMRHFLIILGVSSVYNHYVCNQAWQRILGFPFASH